MFTFVTYRFMQKRIQQIIDKFQLSPNTFANEIGVNRSTISHILSGRNKPSIEVLQKILSRFNELSASWLLIGQGSMFEDHQNIESKNVTAQQNTQTLKSIEKIVVFYSDNTFEEYNPNK